VFTCVCMSAEFSVSFSVSLCSYSLSGVWLWTLFFILLWDVCVFLLAAVCGCMSVFMWLSDPYSSGLKGTNGSAVYKSACAALSCHTSPEFMQMMLPESESHAVSVSRCIGPFCSESSSCHQMEADELFELLVSAFFKVHAWRMFELFLVMRIAACLYAAFASKFSTSSAHIWPF